MLNKCKPLRISGVFVRIFPIKESTFVANLIFSGQYCELKNDFKGGKNVIFFADFRGKENVIFF